MKRFVGVIVVIAILVLVKIFVFVPRANDITTLPVLTKPLSEVIKLTDDSNTFVNKTIEDQIAEKLDKYYDKAFVSIEQNDFQLVDNFYIPNSPIYFVQKNKIKYLFEKKISCKLISYEIKKVYLGDSPQNYYAEVLERVDWKFSKDASYFDEHLSTYSIECLLPEAGKFNDAKNTNNGIAQISLFDYTENENFENKQNEARAFQKILPQRQKEDKYAMVQQALNGIYEYMEIDYKKIDAQRVFGCNYFPSEGLNQLLRAYDERINKIMEKKIKRKINMIEIFRSEQKGNEGIVELSLRLENYINQNSIFEDIKLQIGLKRVAPETWYISQVYGLPFP